MKNLENIFSLKVLKKYWYMYVIFFIASICCFFILDTAITFIFLEFDILGVTDLALETGVYVPLHPGFLGVLTLWFFSGCCKLFSTAFKKWLKVIDEFNSGDVANEQ